MRNEAGRGEGKRTNVGVFPEVDRRTPPFLNNRFDAPSNLSDESGDVEEQKETDHFEENCLGGGRFIRSEGCPKKAEMADVDTHRVHPCDDVTDVDLLLRPDCRRQLRDDLGPEPNRRSPDVGGVLDAIRVLAVPHWRSEMRRRGQSYS